MSYQMGMFAPPKLTTRERFEMFHADNPQVYRALVQLCTKAKRMGRDRWGINGAIEVVRWSRLVSHGEEWKINNNFAPHYARLIMDCVPSLEGFFELREIRKA